MPICDLQIVISQSEQRDGSGWPGDYEDLESGDVVLPGDAQVTEKNLPDTGHRTTILVWYYSNTLLVLCIIHEL